MQRLCTVFQLLLSDERSAVRRKSAAWVSVAVLAATVAALCLISIGDKVYRKQDHRVLITLAEPADRPPV